ncbi:hypothetical protein LTR22_026966 [Elasticomyces elasticus]|nr:hypothetical protein LTR22_026966 [Elasticomyces elasticus]
MSDNASSNDKALTLLLRKLELSIDAKAIAGRCLRCFGRIVNLATQSLLATSGAKAKKAARELDRPSDDQALMDDIEGVRARWVHAGPLGKL